MTGFYDKTGYICVSIKHGPVYEAGNHPTDSAVFLDPHDNDALPIARIREFCEITTQDLAAEYKEPYCGVEKYRKDDDGDLH